MAIPHFHSQYDTPTDPGVDFTDDPGQTSQEFKDETDINILMSRYMRTGIIPETTKVATYGDFANVGDYHEAQNTLIHAREQFDALDARVRARFHNDPTEFLAFVHDKANYAEARDLGLLQAEQAPDLAGFDIIDVDPTAPPTA